MLHLRVRLPQIRYSKSAIKAPDSKQTNITASILGVRRKLPLIMAPTTYRIITASSKQNVTSNGLCHFRDAYRISIPIMNGAKHPIIISVTSHISPFPSRLTLDWGLSFLFYIISYLLIFIISIDFFTQFLPAQLLNKKSPAICRFGGKSRNLLYDQNSIDATTSRTAPKTKSKPSAAGSIWKGGAAE